MDQRHHVNDWQRVVIMCKTKEALAMNIIGPALMNCRNPILMCSFGKDSMVLLHMLRKVRPDIPVIWHREVPHATERYNFAVRMISELGLKSYDFPPTRTAVVETPHGMDIANVYHYGNFEMFLPTRLRQDLYSWTVCGLHDVLLRPTGRLTNFPWDMVFIGHKNSDTDPRYGRVPVDADMVIAPGCPTFAYPLKMWSDHDVWDYIRAEGVRYDNTRYAMDGTDTHHDEFPACTNCLQRGTQGVVYCPRMKVSINSFSEMVQRMEFPKKLSCQKESICPAM